MCCKQEETISISNGNVLKINKLFHIPWMTQSAGAVKYTDSILLSGKTPPKGVLDMTLTITLSLPFLPGSLWPGVVALDRILSIGQKELNCVISFNWIV